MATLCESCGDVGPQCRWPTLRQCSGKVTWTLWQCQLLTLVTNVETTFRQHCSPVLVTNIETTFRQCCIMLWQCLSPMLVTNVETTNRQCCMNTVATLLPNIGDQHWDNVRAGLSYYCGNITPQHWWPMLRQCSGNIAWMLWQCHSQTLVTDVETMFRQCCLNVVSMSLPNVGDWHWDNIQAILH